MCKGRDPANQTRHRAPASDSHRGSPLLGAQAPGPGGGELTESGGRSGPVFRLCRLGCEGWVGNAPARTKEPLFRRSSRWRDGRARDSGTGARGRGARSRAAAAAGRPLRTAAGRGGPRSRRRGAPPTPPAPTREDGRGGQEPGTALRSPPPADLGRRAEGAPGPFPFPGAPGRAVPSLEKDPVSSEAGAYPGRGGSRRGPPSHVGPGRCGCAALRCAGSGARRAPCTAAPARTSSSSGSAPPLGRAPRSAAAPRPAPPGAGMRAPPPRAADLRCLLPSARARTVGRWRGREKEKEIKHLDLSLERCQRAQSNYSPRGKKITKKKKKFLLLFS